MSNKIEHTPGPWFVINDTLEIATSQTNGWDYDDCVAATTIQQGVDNLPLTEGISLDECKANAIIMAASPEMYEVLKDVQDYCETFAPTSRILEMIKPTLAKIEANNDQSI